MDAFGLHFFLSWLGNSLEVASRKFPELYYYAEIHLPYISLHNISFKIAPFGSYLLLPSLKYFWKQFFIPLSVLPLLS
jgi:hypothetical protein